jgi:hypothetical protein
MNHPNQYVGAMVCVGLFAWYQHWYQHWYSKEPTNQSGMS